VVVVVVVVAVVVGVAAVVVTDTWVELRPVVVVVAIKDPLKSIASLCTTTSELVDANGILVVGYGRAGNTGCSGHCAERDELFR
jgi:fumarate reductase subunit C